ncbi:cytochrome oxidase, partial [Mesorhizobium sp. M7A.F.Ca.CA.001.08.2.1]
MTANAEKTREFTGRHMLFTILA